MKRSLLLFFLASVLSSCGMPYKQPVFVRGAADFDGIVSVVERSGDAPVDVLLVHGMCAHDETWAYNAINMIIRAIDSNVPPSFAPRTAAHQRVEGIQVVRKSVDIAGGSIRFSALIWSPLTMPLKKQLLYDMTGEPSNCATADVCKPERAKFNGLLKDGLLNDCLADAMIYQGRSRTAIREAMIEAIAGVVEDAERRARGIEPGPLVLISESLGSKLTFDALEYMTRDQAPAKTKIIGDMALDRLALVFMRANQLPILGLADQDIRSKAPRDPGVSDLKAEDSLQRILEAKRKPTPPTRATTNTIPAITLVAFTDPNDLLSYRLQSSRYRTPDIAVADVLVSNAMTYLGLFERPDKAHTDYRTNAAVASLIACGQPKSKRCK